MSRLKDVMAIVPTECLDKVDTCGIIGRFSFGGNDYFYRQLHILHNGKVHHVGVYEDTLDSYQPPAVNYYGDVQNTVKTILSRVKNEAVSLMGRPGARMKENLIPWNEDNVPLDSFDAEPANP